MKKNKEREKIKPQKVLVYTGIELWELFFCYGPLREDIFNIKVRKLTV